MEVEYILGRARTKKKDILFKNIKKDILDKNIEKIILIVPEQYTLHSEFDAIKTMEIKGLLKLEVSSFKLLAYQGLKSMGLEEETIDEVGRYIFINKIVSRNLKKLKVFKNLKEEGMIEEISRTIDYLKENIIASSEIEDKIVNLKNNNILKEKLKDILLIYSEYEKEIQNNYIDDKDFLQKYIKECGFKEIDESVKVYFSDFNSFNKIEYEIIRGIIKRSKKTTFLLDHSTEDINLFVSSDRTLRKIREISLEEHIESNTIVLKNEINCDEIDFLEKHLYSYNDIKYDAANKKITILKGINRNREIELIASNILKKVKNSGYRWKDILIVNNDMEIYRGVIKRIFSKYEIPFFLDETSSILNMNIVSYIENFLEMIKTNMSYESVFNMLKTGLSKLTSEEIEILENYVLETGLKGKDWFKKIDKFKNSKNFEIERFEKIEQARNKFIVEHNIEKLMIDLRKKKTPKEFNKIVVRILEDARDKLQEKVDYFLRENEVEKGNEIVQVWGGIIDILNQIENISEEKEITLKEYLVDIKSGMSSFELGSLPPTLDQVIIGKLERSRTKDIKIIFVVGLNDGILPSSGTVNSILTDEEQDELKNIGIDISNKANEKIENERFYSYMAMSKPTDFLFLSYALSTNEGETLRSSMILERVKKLFPNIDNESIFNEENFYDTIYTPNNAMYFLTNKLRKFKEEGSISQEWVDLLSWFQDSIEYRETINIIFRGMFESEQLKDLSEEDIDKLYKNNIKASISSIEAFNKCPFAHFMKYNIGPKERKNREIKSMYVGNILHTTMEKYFKENTILDLKTIEKDMSDSIIERNIEEITENYNNKIFSYNYKNMYYLNHLKRIAKKAAWIANLQTRDGEVENILSEVSFGENNSTYDGISLKTTFKNKEIQFDIEGKIDRVDFYNVNNEKFVNVIDYKSGKKQFSLSELYYGVQIQLIVYLMVVMENRYYSKEAKEGKKYSPGGIFYFKIEDPIIESIDSTQKKIMEEVKNSMKLSGLVVKNIELMEKIDKNILKDLKSNTIKVTLKKGSTFEQQDYYENSEIIEEGELNRIIYFMEVMLKETILEILKGKIKANPYKCDNDNACMYCEYISICMFDNRMKGYSFKSVKKLKRKEVIEKITKFEKRNDDN